MSNFDLTSVLFILLLLIGLAQLLGYFFVKLRQPKVLGEILAGVVLGPSLIGRLAFPLMEATKERGIISPKFYTTLVLAAVLTSVMAGAWLDYVLRRGWPLLTPTGTGEPTIVSAERASPLLD